MMTRQQFTAYLRQHLFRELFITEMGWNNPQSHDTIPLTIDDIDYSFNPVAQRNGFNVFACQVKNVPTATAIRKMDARLKRAANDYICIFYTNTDSYQVWAAPVNTTEKRDVIVIEYETTDDKLQFLYQKIQNLCFNFDEQTTISEVRERIAGEFKVNGEKLTKDFYTGFRQEHKAFADFITGIDDHVTTKDNKSKQWYASVMLNRLMFCYFIQKKGFLNGDEHYLRNKLKEVQEEEGKDRFFGSFYRTFLMHLFHDGLNAPQHDNEFLNRFGRIPYLNGGMFDEHQLEKDYKDIDIKDEAFERLFNFFDKWRWHLDYRQTSSGKDINPDVLGYIFEQYINDRAEMGAYYTKEDITGYISKNCIIPFLIDKVGIKDIASLVKNTADRYIYSAVSHGYSPDWQQRIPQKIAQGIDTGKPSLLERRADWNTPTPDSFGLPTEIWRETIERLQRCDSLLDKIRNGEIKEINDFITYNLNITLFAKDILEQTNDHLLIKHFFDALQDITILDPTCGSGAFLFAAMNILEPLYDTCITRMEDFHQQNENLFAQELDDIRKHYRANREYFIYKTIILRNLYGVDIMVEATEIAKLRLFLKMVAVVEPDYRQDNMGLAPLPDIDFNIRCGNTLVGFATEQELNDSLEHSRDIVEELANQEFAASVKQKMQLVADTFEIFKSSQLNPNIPSAKQKQHKEQLRQRLAELNDLLNHRLMLSMLDSNADYDTFLRNYQPFHWLAEFYQIMKEKGGFDVIIGNPPYVEYNKKVNGVAVSDIYQIKDYKTLECGNLYAYCMERSKNILQKHGYISMIVPLSGHSTERMSPLVSEFYEKFGLHLHLNLSADANPQKLFEGVKFRLGIFFATNCGSKGRYSTKYTRWFAEERPILFTTKANYVELQDFRYQNIIPKIGNPLLIDIFKKIQYEKPFFTFVGQKKCLYHNVPVNWIRSHTFVPYFKSERNGEGITTQLKQINFETDSQVNVGSSILNSTLFFIWWLCNSDCYHINKPEIANFLFTYNDKEALLINRIAHDLATDMQQKSMRRVYNYQTSGRVEYDEFYMKLSKPIIDEIDKVLAKHYGFTDEELDFIINYDIKYRMGSTLNDEDA